jgi:hypothetical protein
MALTSQRQFDRLLEMLLLKQLDQSNEEKVRAYRLQVKARLYRFNYVGASPPFTVLLSGTARAIVCGELVPLVGAPRDRHHR